VAVRALATQAESRLVVSEVRLEAAEEAVQAAGHAG
jgi:hypothetical protein